MNKIDALQNVIKGNLKDISINFEEKDHEINKNEYDTIVSFDMSVNNKAKISQEIKKINVENKIIDVPVPDIIINKEPINIEENDDFLCLICQRKFKTFEKLKMHEEISAMHKVIIIFKIFNNKYFHIFNF